MGLPKNVIVLYGFGFLEALRAVWKSVETWFQDWESPVEPTPGRNGRLFGYRPWHNEHPPKSQS